MKCQWKETKNRNQLLVCVCLCLCLIVFVFHQHGVFCFVSLCWIIHWLVGIRLFSLVKPASSTKGTRNKNSKGHLHADTHAHTTKSKGHRREGGKHSLSSFLPLPSPLSSPFPIFFFSQCCCCWSSNNVCLCLCVGGWVRGRTPPPFLLFRSLPLSLSLYKKTI
jgi:hypothetical protein